MYQVCQAALFAAVGVLGGHWEAVGAGPTQRGVVEPYRVNAGLARGGLENALWHVRVGPTGFVLMLTLRGIVQGSTAEHRF